MKKRHSMKIHSSYFPEKKIMGTICLTLMQKCGEMNQPNED